MPQPHHSAEPRILGPVHVPPILHASPRVALAGAGRRRRASLGSPPPGCSTPRPRPTHLPADHARRPCIAAVQSAAGRPASPAPSSSRLALGLPELPAFGDAGDGLVVHVPAERLAHAAGLVRRRRPSSASPCSARPTRPTCSATAATCGSGAAPIRCAVHATLPAGARPRAAAPSPSPTASLTPGDLARSALADARPHDRGARRRTIARVADRSAYELVLTPRTPATRSARCTSRSTARPRCRWACRSTPATQSAPAIDVAFTSIRFGRQAERNFVFSPPADATVHQRREALRTRRAPATPARTQRRRTPRPTTASPARAGRRVVALTARPGRGRQAAGARRCKALTPVSGGVGHGPAARRRRCCRVLVTTTAGSSPARSIPTASTPPPAPIADRGGGRQCRPAARRSRRPG